MASGSGWNLWVWLLGVVVRRYIDFLILLIPTPLVSVLFYSSIPTLSSTYRYTSPKTPTCEVPSYGVVEISLLPVCTGETSI